LPSSLSSPSAKVNFIAVFWHQVRIDDWALSCSYCMFLFYCLWAYVCQILKIVLKYWDKSLIIPQLKQSGHHMNSSPAENKFTALSLHKHVAIFVSVLELSLLCVPPISPFWTYSL
jgi:uncharacterized membrane protein SpoIIM required for sporulation